MSIIASEARPRLFSLIDEVDDGGAAVEAVMRRFISSYQHAPEGRAAHPTLAGPVRAHIARLMQPAGRR